MSVFLFLSLFLLNPFQFLVEVDAHWIDYDTPKQYYCKNKQQLGLGSETKTESNSNSNSNSNSESMDMDMDIDIDIDYVLVFSDEFETSNRSFKNGEDTKWTALDKNDYTNFAIHYYDSDMITTSRIGVNSTTGTGVSGSGGGGGGSGSGSTDSNISNQHTHQHTHAHTIGVLNLTTAIEDKTYDLSDVIAPKNEKNQKQTSITKNYKSGMLQGMWYMYI